MTVGSALTGVFVLGLIVFLAYAGRLVWQGRSHIDPDRPSGGWPFSLALWRGTARAMPVLAVAVSLLFLGGYGREVLSDPAARDVAGAVGLVGLLGIVLVAMPITYFSRPRRLVPPDRRDEPSTVAEWRRGA